MVKKSIYEEVDGLDESFTISLNDVDLCLKIREKGYLNIFTPFAELYHYESKTRGMEEGEKLRRYERECAHFRDKWKEQLDAGDPYYNPVSYKHLDVYKRQGNAECGKGCMGAAGRKFQGGQEIPVCFH